MPSDTSSGPDTLTHDDPPTLARFSSEKDQEQGDSGILRAHQTTAQIQHRPDRLAGTFPDAPDGDPEKDPVQSDENVRYTVQWDEDEPENPRNWKAGKKWLMVMITSMTAVMVTCTSSIYTSTYLQLEEEFGVSEIVCTLGLSLFVIGLGIGPMLIGPLSELHGRRPVYIVSLTFFLIFIIPCAAAQNIQTLLIGRFLNGFAGSAFLTVAGGMVGDMFTKRTLSTPMLVFTASPFVGPEVGPILGGVISSFAYWRWAFYVMAIWTVVMLLLIIVFVPETFHPVLLTRKAKGLRKTTGDERYIAPAEKEKKSLLRTIAMSFQRPFVLMVMEPMCFNLCLYSAILLGILYLFFGAFNQVFTTNHDFNLWQVGLSFLGLLIGLLLGLATDRMLVSSRNSAAHIVPRITDITQMDTKLFTALGEA